MCSYEQDAHILFECWTIPDKYIEGWDPAYLSRLMEKELLPADDEDDEDDDDGGKPLSGLLLETAKLMTSIATTMLDASSEALDMEYEATLRSLDEYEGPENDCAE